VDVLIEQLSAKVDIMDITDSADTATATPPPLRNDAFLASIIADEEDEYSDQE